MARLSNEQKQAKANLETALGGLDFAEIDIYKFKGSRQELEIIRRTLAKRSNQRLVRLENATSKITGEKYSEYGASELAYAFIEEKYGTPFDKGDKPRRFNEKLSTTGDKWDIKREITAMQNFLSSKSSTVAGQRSIEKKREKTFAEGKYGKSGKPHSGVHSNKSFYNFLNSSTYDRLKKAGFDSERIVDFYGRYQDKMSHEEIMRVFDKALSDWEKNQDKASIKNLNARLMRASSSKNTAKAKRGGKKKNAARSNKKS